MRKKSFGRNLRLLPLLFLNSCAVGQIPDKPVCLEFSPTRGKCVHIISGKEFMWDETHLYEGRTWWENRPAMVLVPASSWEGIKSYTIKACKKYKNCQDEVTSWDRTVERIDALVKSGQ